MDNPFLAIRSQWQSKITKALNHKREKFQNDADEAMKFFNGPYDFLYNLKYKPGMGSFVFIDHDGKEMPKPSCCITINKVAEMVQIFGPTLYHRNPHRQVNPRKVPMIPIDVFGDSNDPNVQQQFMPIYQQVERRRGLDNARAVLLEFYQNFTPTALNLKDESRNAVDEAIIKGMGTLWHEVYYPVGSSIKMFGSFYDTVDNLVIDPDMESLAGAKWVSRRCCHPVWQIEDEYGYKRGSIRGNTESFTQQSIVETTEDGDYRRKQGMTNDLLVYWKIYSKMGLGNRLHGIAKATEASQDFERFGDFVYLAVCDTLQHPLNIPPDIWGDEAAISKAVQWETPFWADDGWPFTPLSFHWVPREVWPMSHVKPGMGELKFLNWAYSFIAGKIRTACRDFIAVQKSAAEELKRTLVQGTDYELIELEKSHGTISEVVQFLQHPQFQGDIWKVILAVNEQFEKRVGLTELMYAMTTTQMRSAQEAAVKGDQLRVRPDDMANKVEDAMTEVARKEAIGARWHLEPIDLVPVMGEVGAYFWGQLVSTADLNELIHQLEYRIEAGSIRKPNKDRDAANMNQAMQTILPILQQWAGATGDVGALNALLGDWAKSIDLDPERYLLKPPPPPPDGPSPEEQKAQLEQQKAQLDMQMKQLDMQMEAQKFGLEMGQDQESFRQEMSQDRAKHTQEMAQLREKHRVAMQTAKKANTNGQNKSE